MSVSVSVCETRQRETLCIGNPCCHCVRVRKVDIASVVWVCVGEREGGGDSKLHPAELSGACHWAQHWLEVLVLQL